jgi:hypothetical protein
VATAERPITTSTLPRPGGRTGAAAAATLSRLKGSVEPSSPGAPTEASPAEGRDTAWPSVSAAAAGALCAGVTGRTGDVGPVIPGAGPDEGRIGVAPTPPPGLFRRTGALTLPAASRMTLPRASGGALGGSTMGAGLRGSTGVPAGGAPRAAPKSTGSAPDSDSSSLVRGPSGLKLGGVWAISVLSDCQGSAVATGTPSSEIAFIEAGVGRE